MKRPLHFPDRKLHNNSLGRADIKNNPKGCFLYRAGGARTHDLTVPNRAFYLLNYSPIERVKTKTLREA